MASLPLSFGRFSKRTTQLALAASLVARRQFGISPDAVYTYALFHDAAIPMMMRRFPTYTEMLEKCRLETLGDMDLEVGIELFEKAMDFLGVSEDDLDDMRQRVSSAIEGG